MPSCTRGSKDQNYQNKIFSCLTSFSSKTLQGLKLNWLIDGSTQPSNLEQFFSYLRKKILTQIYLDLLDENIQNII